MDKQGLSISLSADLAAFRRGMSDAIKITKGTSKAVEDESKQMVDALVKQFEKIAVAKSFRAANLQTVELVRTMKLFGMEGSAAFREVVKTAGKLQDELQDTKGLIDAAAPGGAFKAFAGTLQGVAQGFAGVQGAMALFGNESEDVQKTLLKVQAAMALAEGLKSIEKLKDGFNELGQAIKSNPMLFLVGAVVALGGAIYALTRETDKYAEVQAEAFKQSAEGITTIEQLSSVINDETASEQEKFLAKQKLIDQFPEYYGNLDAAKSSTEDFNIAIRAQIGLLSIQAKAQAAQGLYIKALEEEFKATQDLATSNKYLNLIKYKTLGMSAQKDIRDAQEKGAAYKEMFETFSKEALIAEAAAKKFGKVDPAKPEKKVKEEKDKPFENLTNDAFNLKVVKLQIALSNVQKELKLIPPASTSSKTAIDALAKSVTGLDAPLTKTPEQLAKLRKEMNMVEVSAVDMTNLVKGAMMDMATNIGSAFQSAVENSTSLVEGLGNAFLGSLIGFTEQFGKLLIAAGLAKISLEAIGISGVGAVVAGVALIAAAGAVKGHLAKGQKSKKFAGGGIVDGFSNTGDKVPAMVNSGEMILNKSQQANLFKMVSAGGGNSGGSWAFRVTAREVYMLYEEGKRQYNRG